MKPFLRMIWTAMMVVLPLGACSSPGSDLPTLPSTPGLSSYRLGPGDQLDLKVTFKPGEAKIRAEVTIGPEKDVEHAQQRGDTGRVRGRTRTKRLRECPVL